MNTADESGGMGDMTGRDGGAARYVPGELTLDNTAQKMREAAGRLRAGGALVMDMSESGDCDSAALGAMIEWRRLAAERKCDLRFENIGGRLAKLARLYQVAELFGIAKTDGGAGAEA